MRVNTQRCPDCPNHLIHIILNLIIRKADYPVAKFLKRFFPFLILNFPANMHAPIHLDDETPAPTAKINHVRANRLLPIEFMAIQLAIA